MYILENISTSNLIAERHAHVTLRFPYKNLYQKPLTFTAKMMNKIKDIGNSIHHSIQLEVDYPSLHEDNKLPLLDIKIWTEKEEDQQDERKHQTREEEQEDKTDETDPKKVFQKEENKKEPKYYMNFTKKKWHRN